jgi:GTPase Era involved in 16S rRNA processing
VAVTSEVKELIFKDITFIDTPGFNDSDKKRTDAEIFSLIKNHVN